MADDPQRGTDPSAAAPPDTVELVERLHVRACERVHGHCPFCGVDLTQFGHGSFCVVHLLGEVADALVAQGTAIHQLHADVAALRRSAPGPQEESGRSRG